MAQSEKKTNLVKPFTSWDPLGDNGLMRMKVEIAERKPDKADEVAAVPKIKLGLSRLQAELAAKE